MSVNARNFERKILRKICLKKTGLIPTTFNGKGSLSELFPRGLAFNICCHIVENGLLSTFQHFKAKSIERNLCQEGKTDFNYISTEKVTKRTVSKGACIQHLLSQSGKRTFINISTFQSEKY